MSKKQVVVLGAGVTGLASAYRLSKKEDIDVHVVERQPVVGGLCGSFKDGDFILDYGPHKFYTLLDGITEELCEIMDGDLLERDKAQSLYMHGKYFAYPLKMGEMITKFPILESAKILLSFGLQTFKNFLKRTEPLTYEEFITERFGKGLYNSIFAPMAKKIYGDPRTLDRKLAEVRISSPGLISVIKQLLFRSNIDRSIQAPKFHYPKYGYGMIPERLKEKSEQNGATFHLGAELTEISEDGTRVTGVTIKNAEGKTIEIPCDELVYTIPINLAARLLKKAPASLTQSCGKIRSRHTIIYYFLIESKPLLPSMWVFFPEQRFRFGRLSEMTRFSPETTPEGHTALMVDFTCEDDDPVWKMGDEELGELLLKQLEPLGLFTADQVRKRFSKRFKGFYPVYKVGFQDHLNHVRELEKTYPNLYFIGRHGDFNYNNADQCLDMGFHAADHITGEEELDWQRIRSDRFEKYKIVD